MEDIMSDAYSPYRPNAITYQGKRLIEHDKETIVRLFEATVPMLQKRMQDQMTIDRKQMLRR